jgi:hypothetical protein
LPKAPKMISVGEMKPPFAGTIGEGRCWSNGASIGQVTTFSSFNLVDSIHAHATMTIFGRRRWRVPVDSARPRARSRRNAASTGRAPDPRPPGTQVAERVTGAGMGTDRVHR